MTTTLNVEVLSPKLLNFKLDSIILISYKIFLYFFIYLKNLCNFNSFYELFFFKTIGWKNKGKITGKISSVLDDKINKNGNFKLFYINENIPKLWFFFIIDFKNNLPIVY